jgi:heparan-alpha-glucosaminide N-acetyltransferase
MMTPVEGDTVPSPPAGLVGKQVTEQKRHRITSLDWARGCLILVNLLAISYLFPPPGQLRHPEWMGVTFFDLIFPTFVALSGCGMAFAYARRVDPLVTLRRMVVLFGVGLLYNGALSGSLDPAGLRMTGPLQVYAVLVGVVALLHLLVHSLRGWVLTTLAVVLVWTAVTWSFNQQCPTGMPTRSCNLSAAVDLRLIPLDNLYRQGAWGHDPEGIPVMAGALITMLVGIVAGKILLAGTGPRVTLTRLVVWVAFVAVLGLTVAQLVTPFKRTWTPSFAVLSATIGLTLLILGFFLHDHPAPAWWKASRDALAQPFVAMGRNALLLYFGAHIVLHQLYVVGDPSLATRIRAAELPWGEDARMLFLGLMVATFVALAWVLHKRRIYIHA